MELEKYKKNGKECFLCLVRKKLIQITPEEKIRQEFILYLVEKKQVPVEMIDVEVPLSYFKERARGRADIIVYNKNNKPLILIECKAPDVPITVKTFEQIQRYNTILNAEILIATNSIETYILKKNSADDFIEIKELPVYSKILKNKGFRRIPEYKYVMPKLNLTSINKNYRILRRKGILGKDSKKSVVSLVTNLSNLFYDDTLKAEEFFLDDFKVIDKGLRYMSYGNAAGGAWAGDYRFFLLEDKETRNSEIISFAIMGKGSYKNHPKWGNIIGLTMLNVAIDDYEKSHNSLQYSLDRFVIEKDDTFYFYHDGTLTNGKKGRVKNSEVIKFIADRAPYLIKDEKIFLGKISSTKQMTWNDKEVIELVKNFAKYSLLRDEFRKQN